MSNYFFEIDSVSNDEWDTNLKFFNDASIYQSSSYGVIRWRQNNLSRIILKKDNEIVSMAQVRIIKVPIINRGIAYITYGPMWRTKNKENNKDDLYFMLEKIIEEYAVKRKLLIQIRPNYLLSESKDIIDKLDELGFKKNTQKKPYHTLIVNLKRDMAEIRKSFHQKWRNRLNKADKNDLEVTIDSSLDSYLLFESIYNELINRKKFKTTVDINEFIKIQNDLPENLKMQTILCRQNGDIVSGAVFTTIGDIGIYLLGATPESGSKYQGAYMNQWKIIEYCKNQDCQYYDLGGIDQENNPHVFHFKYGISKVEMNYIGQYELCKDPFTSIVINVLKLLFKI
jgi:lipid II:glycine glycyltransferase (peptidoglycan interpeptide bridge formation enzyme)